MANCPFCNLDRAPDPAGPNKGDGKRSSYSLRRAWRGTQWLFPAALLVLMPKCPLCLAAYIALFTGIGITLSTAQWIQLVLPVCCWMALAYLAIRHLPVFSKQT